ncbi:PREDICTED: uncharacterized protein LOC109326975 [Lupinus angustifolius]|uniref:uncharacterized protein LOC109326975 n=1 Tax=Lupinus angustifolius TaxID=3871 RepID=UPI00092EEEAE|nr:PREDICTED: uncharacterized protein LOC109326975 [Lupinus angustifolius]
MAFDQNSVPNVTRTIAEESLIRTGEFYTPNSVRTGEFCYTPNSARTGSVQLYYPASVSDSALVRMGYGNVASSIGTWCVGPVVGFNYGHSFPNPIAGGNGVVDGSGGAMASGHGYPMNLVNHVVGNDLDNALQGKEKVISNNASDQVGGVVSTKVDHQVSNECGDESVSVKTLKLMCRYGGKILPRPSDGMLRYVGGQTRIISVKRDVSFNDLMQKMADTYGQLAVIKYQLPDEELDALVSVSCTDDLENMMEEYDRLIESSPDGSAKLRLFLISASELDPFAVIQFGDFLDSGHKYVEAVNGFTDGISGKLTRKENSTSAASMQNSDFSGMETLDRSNAGQGDVSGAPKSDVLSPKGNVAVSHDSAVNLVVSEPCAFIYSDSSAVSLGTPATNSGPTSTSPFQNEVELENSVPVMVSQQQFGLHEHGMEIPLPAPYLQPFVDPRQEVMNHADYVKLHPQIGFPNPHLLGQPGSIYSQHPFHDYTAGLVSHQAIPAVQMMTRPSSHVGGRQNMIQPQPLMQPQQSCLGQYNDENKSAVRIIQLPTEQSYNACPVQFPYVMVGGNYHWVQVPQPEHFVFTDALLPQQLTMIPEKVQRVKECYMCQKKFPHSHSDPVIKDQHNSCAGSIADSIPSYNSLPVEENLKAQVTNRILVTAPLKEGNAELVVGTRPMVFSKLEPPGGVPCSDATTLSRNLDLEPEGEKNFIQRSDGFDHSRNAIIQEATGRTSEKQPPSDGLTGTAPLSSLGDVIHHHVVPVENCIKEDVLVNKIVTNDIPLVGVSSTEASQCIVQESPQEYTNELTSIVSKADAVGNWTTQDHVKSIDGRVDILNIGNPEIHVNNNNFDYNTQHAVEEKGVVLDNNPGRSILIVDANQIQLMDGFPSSTMEFSTRNNCRPVEYNEAAQPAWGVPGSNPQLKSGNHHMNGAISSSISPSARLGNLQGSSNSLFINQDPWNLHGTYFPPPRPKKIALKKETYSHKNQFGENPDNSLEQNLESQLDGSLYRTLKHNLILEDAQSAKGSSEDRQNQQHQAVAEGVAASVLHSSTPSNPDLPARDVSRPEDMENRDAQNNLIDIQHTDKAQDVKRKLPEKANLSFPESDIGSLQVVKNSDLEELIKLGSGTFGTVYHGKWRGTDIAIKRINDRCFSGKPSEQDRLRDDFWNEAVKLADLHHPNVVAFYGVVLDGPGGSVATVTEYMVNGSLRNALQKNGRNLDKRKRLLIAMDAAFGMEYLHGKNIVHFDLKSDNLLVNLRDPHRPICKVGDLGLSKVKCQTLISGGVRGTLPWMAPELLNGSSSLVSDKVDVFSFGIVMWELLTGEEPYADLHYGAIIGGIVSNTLRPAVPKSCDPEWRLLMERCWSSDPSERPTFTEIANELRSMSSKISPKFQNQQQQPASLQSQVQK